MKNKKIKINWFTKFLMKYFPNLFMRKMAREMNIDYQKIDLAMNLFSDAKRIDIKILNEGGRGFIIIIDQKLSLHFYQNGDTFYYDGHEIGEYERGDVTVFDKIKD